MKTLTVTKFHEVCVYVSVNKKHKTKENAYFSDLTNHFQVHVTQHTFNAMLLPYLFTLTSNKYWKLCTYFITFWVLTIARSLNFIPDMMCDLQEAKLSHKVLQTSK